MSLDEQVAKLISDAVAPLSQKIEAQNQVITDLAGKLRTINEWITQHTDAPPSAPPPTSPPPTSPPPTSPPPTSPPPTSPPPAGPRTRADVQRILLEEFAKQTSFIPGGNNGPATPAEINDPTRAIQKWIDSLIANHKALTLPEADLRVVMAGLIRADVQKYGWAVNYPPKPPSGPVISGTATMP